MKNMQQKREKKMVAMTETEQQKMGSLRKVYQNLMFSQGGRDPARIFVWKPSAASGPYECLLVSPSIFLVIKLCLEAIFGSQYVLQVEYFPSKVAYRKSVTSLKCEVYVLLYTVLLIERCLECLPAKWLDLKERVR